MRLPDDWDSYYWHMQEVLLLDCERIFLENLERPVSLVFEYFYYGSPAPACAAPFGTQQALLSRIWSNDQDVVDALAFAGWPASAGQIHYNSTDSFVGWEWSDANGTSRIDFVMHPNRPTTSPVDYRLFISGPDSVSYIDIDATYEAETDIVRVQPASFGPNMRHPEETAVASADYFGVASGVGFKFTHEEGAVCAS